MWSTSDIISQVYTPTFTTTTPTTYDSIKFKIDGPTIPSPRRATDYVEGITIEFWFYIDTLPSDSSYYIELFSLTNSQGVIKSYVD